MNSTDMYKGEGEFSGLELAHQKVNELSFALEAVRHRMRDIARDSILSNVDTYLKEEADQARRVVAGATGLPIEGGLRTNQYFIASEGVYEQGLLRNPSNGVNPFRGVVRGIGEVPTPTRSGSAMRFCVAVDPLYTLHNRYLGKYYADRDWLNWLRQPFGLDEYQDRTLFVPIDALSVQGVSLLSEWNGQTKT